MLLLLLGCIFGPPVTAECSWEEDDSLSEIAGVSSDAVLERWEGEHRYRAIGMPQTAGPLEDHQVAPGWFEHWNVVLKPSGDAIVRSAPGCGSHLAVPLEWSISSANGGIVTWSNPGLDSNDRVAGLVTVNGTQPEEWDLRLYDPVVEGSLGNERFYEQFPFEREDVTPALGLKGAGDYAELTLYQIIHSDVATGVGELVSVSGRREELDP